MPTGAYVHLCRLDVEKPGAHRCVRPLVQAGAVVVAIEVGDLIRKVAERVRAVDDGGNAARTRHLADAAHRKDLAGAIGDVAEQYQLRTRRDGALEALVEIVGRRRRHGKRNRLEHDPLAPLALPECGQHARVVLIGGEDFVAALQVDSVLRVFQRFARVARDRHLFGIAAGRACQLPPHRFHLPLEHGDHGVVRSHVGVFQIAAHRVLHRPRRRTAIAVVQVDDVAVDAEGGADFGPEILVLGDLFRRAVAGGAGSGAHAFERTRLKCSRGITKQAATVHAWTIPRPDLIRVHAAQTKKAGGGKRVNRRRRPSRNASGLKERDLNRRLPRASPLA